MEDLHFLQSLAMTFNLLEWVLPESVFAQTLKIFNMPLFIHQQFNRQPYVFAYACVAWITKYIDEYIFSCNLCVCIPIPVSMYLSTVSILYRCIYPQYLYCISLFVCIYLHIH